MKVIHPTDAEFFMDGPEVCRQYIATEKITFGSPHFFQVRLGWN